MRAGFRGRFEEQGSSALLHRRFCMAGLGWRASEPMMQVPVLETRGGGIAGLGGRMNTALGTGVG
jgi:hypothetical protein